MTKSTAKMTLKLDPDKYPGDSMEEKGAYIALDPSMKAAMTTYRFTSNLTEIDTMALAARMQELTDEACSGELGNIETMLAAQAITLDSIFHRLAVQAHQNIGHHSNAVDVYLRLGLKAQNQCRSTIEALASMKSPRQYINQTNVANLMQVNNSHEHLEASNGERMDYRAQTASGRDDQELAALEAFDGSKNSRR
jgi:hypothetical protein